MNHNRHTVGNVTTTIGSHVTHRCNPFGDLIVRMAFPVFRTFSNQLLELGLVEAPDLALGEGIVVYAHVIDQAVPAPVGLL